MDVHNKKNWYNFLLPGKRKSFQAIPVEPLSHHPDARPLEWEEKETIKASYTDGREFFIFAGVIDPRRHQLMVLLKAFSQFKKWQKSEMKLVIAGSSTRWTEELKEKLATYKYRQDVLIIQDPEISVQLSLTAAAYALVYLDNKDIFPVDILNAFQCQVPVIAGKTPVMEQTMAKRGIITGLTDPEELARHLLLLYKDENFRTAVINGQHP